MFSFVDYKALSKKSKNRFCVATTFGKVDYSD